ncbi:MAG TPA: PAS domain S-box protein [Verrucomicrobiae bacterium]|nr:PAS domain S-box protein [Verrucomicrobiae bacterium]
MSKPIYVLIVEDSENDTKLLLEELRQKGFSPIHERVQTAEDMEAALKRSAWDVIISDYVMPQFSGPAALKLMRDRTVDIPFIAVSGTYGEEAAVGMMKAGANDYIVKNNLSRLGPAIEREIEAAQSRRARARAERAQQFLAAIVESTDDAIYATTLDGIIVSWNDGAKGVFGYSAEEIIGHSVSLLYPIDLRDEMAQMQERLRRGERIGAYETIRVHREGRYVPVSMTISPIKDHDGKILGASAIARDITRRKHEEEERTKLLHRLADTLKQVKTLNGLLPICACCKRIRDDHGYWQQVETYISRHSDAVLSHSICPDCSREYQEKGKTESVSA